MHVGDGSRQGAGGAAAGIAWRDRCAGRYDPFTAPDAYEDAQDPYDCWVDVPEDADLLIASDEDYIRVGAGVALPGDMGGDAARDIALGAPHIDGGGSNAGGVLITFGGGI